MTTATTSSMKRLYFATHTYAELGAGITDVCCWHVVPDDGRTAPALGATGKLDGWYRISPTMVNDHTRTLLESLTLGFHVTIVS